jgi:integrase/recombinase XerD
VAVLPSRGRRAGALVRERLAELGWLRASGHEHLAGCLVIPLLTRDGRIAGCTGHRLATRVRGASGREVTVGRSRARVWNEVVSFAFHELIVCGSPLDGLLLTRAGFQNSIAWSAGAGSRGDPVPKMLQRAGVERALLAYRADSAGERVATVASAQLRRVGIASARIRFPIGMGPREYVQAFRGDTSALKPLVQETGPLIAPVGGALRFDPTLIGAVARHLAALRAEGRAASTISGRRTHLERFAAWCERCQVVRLRDVTVALLSRYQETVACNGAHSGASAVRPVAVHRLRSVRLLFQWAARSRLLDHDPSIALELPRLARRLPRGVLSSAEAERALAQPDVANPLGLRDRALMELLYSCGLRRREVIGLDLTDVDERRRVIHVRHGKGGRERYVPVGSRALDWIRRYLEDARPLLVRRNSLTALFISARGGRVQRTQVTGRLRAYLVAAGIDKPGSVHIWRHTMATVMHDGGADIRDLQELLGHSQLTTTQIYTHVSLERLQAVHSRTHPAASSTKRRRDS